MPIAEKTQVGEITTLSAVELAAGVREGRFSVGEVVDAHIRRIEQVNGDLNAVIIPLFDEARAAAAEADAKQARGEPLGRLHGVPVTIKEQYRVAGTQVTLGALNKVGNIYNEEGPLVTKMREEGAIILGKTNIIQTLSNFESDNRVYGRSNNPWNLDRSPGGSSGGEGAIIAAGGSPLGLTGDYGGSTRTASRPISAACRGSSPPVGGSPTPIFRPICSPAGRKPSSRSPALSPAPWPTWPWRWRCGWKHPSTPPLRSCLPSPGAIRRRSM